MIDWKGGILCRYEATNLRHHRHQGDRANVGAFPAHVAPSDDLKTALLCSVNVIWHKLVVMDFLVDRMTACFDSKSIGKFWADVVLSGHQLSECCDHIKHGDTLTDPEEH